jgi:hypothetical protein
MGLAGLTWRRSGGVSSGLCEAVQHFGFFVEFTYIRPCLRHHRKPGTLNVTYDGATEQIVLQVLPVTVDESRIS